MWRLIVDDDKYFNLGLEEAREDHNAVRFYGVPHKHKKWNRQGYEAGILCDCATEPCPCEKLWGPFAVALKDVVAIEMVGHATNGMAVFHYKVHSSAKVIAAPFIARDKDRIVFPSALEVRYQVAVEPGPVETGEIAQASISWVIHEVLDWAWENRLAITHPIQGVIPHEEKSK